MISGICMKYITYINKCCLLPINFYTCFCLCRYIWTTPGLYDQYHNTLATLLDKHAPLKSKNSSDTIPWFSQEIVEAKRVKRRLELQWRKRKSSPLYRSRFRRQVNLVNRMISSAKSQYYTDCVDAAKENPKKLWKTLNSILHRNPETVLPDRDSDKSLADRFSAYFIDKIAKIQAVFPSVSQNLSNLDKPIRSCLSQFNVLSEDDVSKIIRSSPTKSCSLDPWPTFLVKEYLDVLISPITNITNMSLQEGSFPERFKCAIVTPLHKKPSLPRDDLKNYRPVSGLNFISKVIERAVCTQLKSHFAENGLDNMYQSAYKAGHSTETALLKLKNDIHLNLAEGKPTAVILLDLSAAFDTIDQNALIHRLSSQFGVRGTALKWFSMYLSNRSQSVKVGLSVSDRTDLNCGVPQGSVLGPILFSLYTAPLSEIISEYPGLKHLLYADDTQLYITITPENANSTISELQNCLSSVQSWMAANKLKLNPDKTEFIVFGNKTQREKLASFFPVDILGNQLSPSDSVRNLGVNFDSDLTMSKHISDVIRSSFFHIKDLRRIRRHLTKSVATTLANALVSSRLDYCNSLFYSITDKQCRRLQAVQNTLCRIVSRTNRYSSITAPMMSLHWLPIRYRVQFKVNLLTYKVRNSHNPAYLDSYIKPYKSARNTRRSNPSTNMLSLQYYHYKTHKSFVQLSNSFSYSAPRLWNQLPDPVRSSPSLGIFRSRLKTHLWNLAYPP